MLNKDFREVLSALSAEGVDYLLVGAYALAAHGLPRATRDVAVWVRCSEENAERTWRALAMFGPPMKGLTPADLCKPGTVIQIGVAPCRIDILTSIEGVEFDEAAARRDSIELGGLSVPVISRADLAANKRACGRPQDLVDLEALQQLGNE